MFMMMMNNKQTRHNGKNDAKASHSVIHVYFKF